VASFNQPSGVHGEVGKKNSTSVGLRAPAGRYDAAKSGSPNTSDGRRVVSSSPGRGPWAAGGSSEMPGDAEEGIGIDMLPLVLSLAPCRGAGCCPRPPLPWRWGRSAPLLFLVFARLFVRASFVSEPEPARPKPLSLASCYRSFGLGSAPVGAVPLPMEVALRWSSGVPVVTLPLSLWSLGRGNALIEN